MGKRRKTMKIFILSAAFLLAAVQAEAKVVPIADWEPSLPLQSGNGRNSSSQDETTCAQLCQGYDITTTTCPEGKHIEDCRAEGCNYYHRCASDW